MYSRPIPASTNFSLRHLPITIIFACVIKVTFFHKYSFFLVYCEFKMERKLLLVRISLHFSSKIYRNADKTYLTTHYLIARHGKLSPPNYFILDKIRSQSAISHEIVENGADIVDNWATKFDTAQPCATYPLLRPRVPVISGWYVSVTRQRLSNLRHVCVCAFIRVVEGRIRIASHKFSSQRQPRFLVLIFKAHAAIYYSTTAYLHIFVAISGSGCSLFASIRILFELAWFTTRCTTYNFILRQKRGFEIYMDGNESNLSFLFEKFDFEKSARLQLWN